MEVFVAEVNSENDEQNHLRKIDDLGIVVDNPDNAQRFMRHVGLRRFNEYSVIDEKRTKANNTTKSSARVCFEDADLHTFLCLS